LTAFNLHINERVYVVVLLSVFHCMFTMWLFVPVMWIRCYACQVLLSVESIDWVVTWRLCRNCVPWSTKVCITALYEFPRLWKD